MATPINIGERRVVIFSDIDDEISAGAIDKLLELSAESAEPIALIISSDGGDLYPGIAVYDLIRSLDNKVTTIGIGRVMSAAVPILLAGHERYCTQGCRFLIHEPYSAGMDGRITKAVLEKNLSEGKIVEDLYFDIIANTPRVRWDKLLPFIKINQGNVYNDFYFGSKEAENFGIVDSTLDPKIFESIIDRPKKPINKRKT